MDAEHKTPLLVHRAHPQLSRDASLATFLRLRDSLQGFLQEKQLPQAEILSNTNWFLKLAQFLTSKENNNSLQVERQDCHFQSQTGIMEMEGEHMDVLQGL